MRESKATSGPFARRPYFTDDEFENICENELRRIGYYPDKPSPVEIEKFVRRRFGLTADYEELRPNVLGYTEFGKNGPIRIVISQELADPNDTIAERRFLTTLGHEVGHCLLHGPYFILDGMTDSLFGSANDQERILCRDIPLQEGAKHHKYNGHWWEFQANKVMTGLLLPKQLVIEVIKAKNLTAMSLAQPLVRGSVIRDLSDVFNVNPVVARYRLDDLFPFKNKAQLTM